MVTFIINFVAFELISGVFIGPNIRRLMIDTSFKQYLNEIEKEAWEAVCLVIRNFLGNHRSDQYENMVAKMLNAYKAMGVNMSLKIHFLHSHLDFFPQTWETLVTNMGKGFTKMCRSLSNAIRANQSRL